MTNDCGPPDGKQHLHENVLEAAKTPAKVKHIAGAAGRTPKTLRRWYACLDDWADPNPDGDACPTCREYTRARSQGVVETLQDCSAKYLARLHGYNEPKEHNVNVAGQEEGPPVKVVPAPDTWPDQDPDGEDDEDA